MIINRKTLSQARKQLAVPTDSITIVSLMWRESEQGQRYIMLVSDLDLAWCVWEDSKLYSGLDKVLRNAVANDALIEVRLTDKRPFFKPIVGQSQSYDWEGTQWGYASNSYLESMEESIDDFFLESTVQPSEVEAPVVGLQNQTTRRKKS